MLWVYGHYNFFTSFSAGPSDSDPVEMVNGGLPVLQLDSPGIEPPTLKLSQRVNSLATVVITPARHTHTRLH